MPSKRPRRARLPLDATASRQRLHDSYYVTIRVVASGGSALHIEEWAGPRAPYVHASEGDTRWLWHTLHMHASEDAQQLHLSFLADG
eukprot:scaffold136_cov418-Prasinococcus_capsulatus_cf.AAC.10